MITDTKQQQETMTRILTDFKEDQGDYRGLVLIGIDQVGNPRIYYSLNWIELGIVAATIQAEFNEHYKEA